MGALHEGHLSLVRASLHECRTTVVSIFVNPLQFGMGEDLTRYPRPLDADLGLLEEAGATLVFVPEASELVPPDLVTFVDAKGPAETLCGAARPGHFRGVLTIVLKLFQLVRPQKAYFGQKDAQQTVVVRTMIRDLNLEVELRVLPIVRDPDGVALSSRNAYLSGDERGQAAALHLALEEARSLVSRGESRPEQVVEAARRVIRERAPGARIDYVELVDLVSLRPVERVDGEALLALAVRLGATRLIDNTILGGGGGRIQG
jgi:pantoate--beta-alanine ligase